ASRQKRINLGRQTLTPGENIRRRFIDERQLRRAKNGIDRIGHAAGGLPIAGDAFVNQADLAHGEGLSAEDRWILRSDREELIVNANGLVAAVLDTEDMAERAQSGWIARRQFERAAQGAL